ncbi:MAG: lamin tail domain-containing protein [Saprospiraceae bacterium]
MDIYQRIWDADQAGNGIQPILKGQKGDEATGYVVIDEQRRASGKHQLFPKVVIPKHKEETYQLCRLLFNNYRLNRSKYERSSYSENQEIHDLLEAIVDTKPMKVVRDYLTAQTGEAFPISRWYNVLKVIYFTPYRLGSAPACTGFEHLVVGEQKNEYVSGYHFWYKYYLDDSHDYLYRDDIHYMGTRSDRADLQVPETSTIAFRWEALDYEKGERVPLYKKAGGFFNGCSIEGLMALGALRFSQRARAPKEGVINGAKYNFVMYRNGNQMITFYPEFVKIVDKSQVGKVIRQTKPVAPKPVTKTVATKTKTTTKKVVAIKKTAVEVKKLTELSIRIIAALVNPIGRDSGNETVTLLNTNPEDVNLKGWRIEGKSGKGTPIDVIIPAGATSTIKLSKGGMSLRNTGGVINLEDHEGDLMDMVSYSRNQASDEGWTIVF